MTANNAAVPLDGWASMNYDTTSNRITTAGYEYDVAGNLVKGQSPDGVWQRYLYDAAGRLVQVKRESDNWIQQANGYGSSRQRAYSWSYAAADLTWYVWGGSSVIAEYAATGWQGVFSWTKSYIYAGSRLLSTFTKNGGGEKLEFHHPDRLGTRLVTDNQANTSFEQNTLPFGTALDAETTGSTNQRFTSYDRSTVASLDYAVNRSYSSGQGRFTTVDPIGMASASHDDPQSYNLYAYVGNNPIDFIDPTGLSFIPVQECQYFEIISYPENGDGGPFVSQRGWWCTTRWVWVDDPEPGGGGGGTPPPPQNPQFDCNSVTEKIRRAFKQVVRRAIELKQDYLDFVPRGIITKSDLMSYLSTLNASVNLQAEERKGFLEGHEQQFKDQQKGLNNNLKKYDDNNCNNRLPVGVRQVAKMKTPFRTRPINTRASPFDQFSEQIKNAAAGVGGAALIYWIVSEASRAFPPRNLIPVP